MYIDPLPLYSLTVHSLPEAQLDSLALRPGVHNTIAVPDMGSGHLTPQFARGVRTDYGKVNVQWHVQGACTPFFSSGRRSHSVANGRDLTFGTTSLTVEANKWKARQREMRQGRWSCRRPPAVAVAWPIAAACLPFVRQIWPRTLQLETTPWSSRRCTLSDEKLTVASGVPPQSGSS